MTLSQRPIPIHKHEFVTNAHLTGIAQVIHAGLIEDLIESESQSWTGGETTVCRLGKADGRELYWEERKRASHNYLTS